MTVLPDPRLRYGDIDQVAEKAADIVDDIRTKPGHEVLTYLTSIAWDKAGFAAQLLMCLAAWVDPDEPADERTARLRAIAKQKENQ